MRRACRHVVFHPSHWVLLLVGATAATLHFAQAGDVFQLVFSQRFERRTFADPFEVYRALRVVNPSPYMVYLQARGAVIVASSPEILCRRGNALVVTWE
jgi:anthranilate synthase component 1